MLLFSRLKDNNQQQDTSDDSDSDAEEWGGNNMMQDKQLANQEPNLHNMAVLFLPKWLAAIFVFTQFVNL